MEKFYVVCPINLKNSKLKKMETGSQFNTNPRQLKSIATVSYSPNLKALPLSRKATLPNVSSPNKVLSPVFNDFQIKYTAKPIKTNSVQKFGNTSKLDPDPLKNLNLKNLKLISPTQSALNSAPTRKSRKSKSQKIQVELNYSETRFRNGVYSGASTARSSPRESSDLKYIKQETYIKSNPHFQKFNKSLHLMNQREADKIGFSPDFFWSEMQREYNKKVYQAMEEGNSSRGIYVKS